jgi:hypothetical protein
VIVYKDGKPFPGIARFDSFAARNKQGALMAQWARMPDHMIAKCAEVQALRKAFPLDLDGIQAADENPYTEPQITVTHISDPAPERVDQPPPSAAAKLRRDIATEFDRLSLTDAEERKIYVAKLANKDFIDQVTDGDLPYVRSSLKDCEDLAALIDLCAVEAS